MLLFAAPLDSTSKDRDSVASNTFFSTLFCERRNLLLVDVQIVLASLRLLSMTRAAGSANARYAVVTSTPEKINI